MSLAILQDLAGPKIRIGVRTPLPPRAEVADVANAILGGTDAVTLWTGVL